MKLILGRRAALLDDEPPLAAAVEAVNVLTMLKAVDFIFDNEQLRGRFKQAYEWLSEFCHPNSFAHEISDRRREGRRAIFEERPSFSERDLSTLIIHSNLTLGMFLHCFDFLHDAINSADGGNA